jgi:hypothetical protein
MTKQNSTDTGKLVGSKDNPLAEFINTIPWEPTLVDPKLLDALRLVINKFTVDRVIVSNKYVLLLLEHLAENLYVEVITTPIGTIPGEFTIVKRIK